MTWTSPDPERNKRILALRGKLSYTLIAKHLGISRNVVAGVCWRADWPPSIRITSPNSHCRNKIGTGKHGPGEYAAKTLVGGHIPYHTTANAIVKASTAKNANRMSASGV